MDDRMEQYWSDVQKTTDKLRAICLGQYTPFEQALPEDVKRLPETGQAAYLADVLLFSLLKRKQTHGDARYEFDKKEIQDAHDWLYGSILYLMTRCNPDDCTFTGMLKLLRLDWGIREVMFSDAGEEYRALKNQLFCPELLDGRGIEVVILSLAKECETVAMEKSVMKQLRLISKCY